MLEFRAARVGTGRLVLFALILLLAIPAAAQAQSEVRTPGRVFGQVRSESSGAPLRFAIVEVVTPYSRSIHAVTDSNGIYVLHGVPAGRRLIRATHIDHAPLEVEVLVSAGSQISMDFGLALRPVRLPVVNALATSGPSTIRDTAAAPAAQLVTAAVHVLEATPGVAEFGLAEAAREVPGQEPVDPSDVLYVRGGGADLKLVLLNGAPVYAPFHLGGLIQALDPDLIGSAELYVGGAPARFDGGLSYVMDLETRSGRTRQPHVTFAVDMLSGRMMAEGPISNDVAYLVGGRAVHGAGAAPFTADPFPYSYGDALGRVDFRVGSGIMSATGFWNREAVRFDSAGTLQPAAEWGNAAGSLRYQGDLLGMHGLFTFAGGHFRTELPIGGIRPLITRATSRRLRAAADFDRELGPGHLAFGASWDRLHVEQRAWPRGAAPDSLGPLALGEADVAGGYVDATLDPADGFRIRAGLRADVFSLDDGVHLAPRLSATLALSDRSSLTLAAGQYRQYVRAPTRTSSLTGDGTIPDNGPNAHALAVARASHLVMAFDQEIGATFGLGLEGFYKMYDGLPSAGGDEAEAAGIDAWLRRTRGSVTGWVGYSLAWIWSEQPGLYAPTRETSFGRHLVSVGLSGPVIADSDFDVRVSYGAGLPFTAIPEPEAATPVFSVVGMGDDLGGPAYAAAEPVPTLPSTPEEAFLRLDAQISRAFQGTWRDLEFEVRPYLRILNLLDRRDALFYHYDRAGGSTAEPRAVAAIPVLPVFGVEWRF